MATDTARASGEGASARWIAQPTPATSAPSPSNLATSTSTIFDSATAWAEKFIT